VLVVSRWTAVAAVASALALSGCANVNGGSSSAPAPATALPAPLASLVKTDIGEYLVTPRAGTPPKDIQETIKQLQSMPGVQSADLKNGQVDLQFLGGSTAEQRANAVKQLSALGEVQEGV
jgi:hypothetical protein